MSSKLGGSEVDAIIAQARGGSELGGRSANAERPGNSSSSFIARPVQHRALSKMDGFESWMQQLKVTLRKRVQQLVADWPEIIGMHGNSPRKLRDGG
jgi:hypothetical protein